MIDDAYLAERRKLVEAATPGPWAYDDGVDVCSDGYSHPYQEKNRAAGVFKPSGPSVFTDDDVTDADGHFIADARASMPLLLDEVERLRALVKTLEHVVQAAEPCCDALRDIAPDGHYVYLGAWDGAVAALEKEKP